MVAGAHEQRQDQGQILGLMPKHLAVNDEWHLAERSDDAGVGAAEHLAEGVEERGEVVLDAASYSARQSPDPPCQQQPGSGGPLVVATA